MFDINVKCFQFILGQHLEVATIMLQCLHLDFSKHKIDMFIFNDA